MQESKVIILKKNSLAIKIEDKTVTIFTKDFLGGNESVTVTVSELKSISKLVEESKL